jgi:hypothetical protein
MTNPTNYYDNTKSKLPVMFYEYRARSLSIAQGVTGPNGSGRDGEFYVNGAFVASDGNAVGPSLVNNNWSNGANPDAYSGKEGNGNRGAVAVSGGKIMVRRFVNDPANDSPKDPAKPFTTGWNVVGDAKNTFGANVSQLMGGGLMLIDESRNVIAENKGKQDESTMRPSSRVCLGNKKNGDAFLVLCFGVAVDSLVTELLGKDYAYLVLFDGSQAFWVRKREGTTRMVIDGAGPDRRGPDPLYSLSIGGSEVGWSPGFRPKKADSPGANDFNFWKRGGKDGRTEKCFIWTQ